MRCLRSSNEGRCTLENVVGVFKLFLVIAILDGQSCVSHVFNAIELGSDAYNATVPLIFEPLIMSAMIACMPRPDYLL